MEGHTLGVIGTQAPAWTGAAPSPTAALTFPPQAWFPHREGCGLGSDKEWLSDSSLP